MVDEGRAMQLQIRTINHYGCWGEYAGVTYVIEDAEIFHTIASCDEREEAELILKLLKKHFKQK
jgi:hypothetical protein